MASSPAFRHIKKPLSKGQFVLSSGYFVKDFVKH